jgi:hypothetical protein
MVAYIRRNGGITTMSWEQLISRIRRTPGSANPLDELMADSLSVDDSSLPSTPSMSMPSTPSSSTSSLTGNSISNSSSDVFKMPAAPRFFCRESELSEITDRLRSNKQLVKVISLYGPGGIGIQ